MLVACRTGGSQARSVEGRQRRFACSATLVAALLLSFGAGEARAQFTASATLESDDVVRGVTLDAGRPDARLSLTYDHSSGAYAGVSGLTDATAQNRLAARGYIGYIGYAQQDGGEISTDVGI